MGLFCTLAVIGILVATWLLARFDARAAYRMLEHSQHLFEIQILARRLAKPLLRF